MTVPAQPYLFDARSAGWSRTTGWERYAREIGSRIRDDPLVRVRTTGTEHLASRLWQDLVATPAAALPVRVVHYPTFPPVPWTRPRARVVYTLHDLTWWRYSTTASRMGRHYYAPIARAAAHSGAHLVTDTQAVKDELVADFGLAPDRVTVVPLGVDLPTPSRPLRRPRPYFLAVGTLEPRKNLERLIEAFTQSGISETHDLVLLGRVGWGRTLPHVDVLSGLDDAGLAAAYAGATAVVVPSLYEGFGLPVVEAMKLGVQVVCSDLPVLREVSGGHARYVDPLDVDSIASGLRAATTASLPASAAEWARGTWRWERTVEMLSDLYRRLDDEAGG